MTDESLVTAVQSGDTRRSLVALRDYLAHELDDNRCHQCRMSQLRTGDTAALALRLQKVIEDIASLPAERADGHVTWLDEIRGRRGDTDSDSDSETEEQVKHGSKSAPRRQGKGRTPRHKQVSP